MLSTIVYNSNSVNFTSKESSILASLLDYIKVVYIDFYINSSTTGHLYVIRDTHDSPVMYYLKGSPPSHIAININNALNNFD